MRTRANSKLLKITCERFNQILERDRKLQAALAVVGEAQKNRIRQILKQQAGPFTPEDRK